MRKTIAVVMVLVLIVGNLTACTNIKDDGTRTRTEGTLVGAGAGAAIGAGVGAAVAGRGGALVGALIGLAVGGLAGLAYGSHVANEKAKFASEEAWLDACMQQAEQTNAKIAEYNTKLQNDVATLEKETTALQKAYAARQTDKKALVAEQKKIANLISQNTSTIQLIESEISAQSNVLADAKSSHKSNEAALIEAEIAALQRHKAQLEETSKQLASMSTRISV